MLITDKSCESITRDAPCFGSPPYAAGKIMLLSPTGVANEISARISSSSLAPKSFMMSNMSEGIAIRRKKEMK